MSRYKPLKAAVGGADATVGSGGLKWPSSPEVHLLQTLVLILLLPDVSPDLLFVAADRGHEIPARPEMLTDEIPPVLAIGPRQVDGILPFDEADHLRHGVLRRDRDHHVKLVGHQMTFHDPARLLLRQPAEDLAKILSQLHIQCLPAALGNESNVIFAVSLRAT